MSPPPDDADWNRAVERAARERWPLRRTPDAARDVVFAESFVGRGPTDHVARGTPVECKACRERVSGGPTDRPGRWRIHESAHRELVDADGWYVLAVYSERAGIVRMTRIEANRVDDRLSGRWTSRGADRSARLPWTDVFDVDALRSRVGP